MARVVEKLSARFVETTRKPGRHSDGNNLYLNVKDSGSKSWLFMYRSGGKRREMGLGDLAKVSLAKAREAARKALELLGEGKDPLSEKHRPGVPTFGERSDAFIEAKKPGWKNEKHAAQWEMTMRVYAAPIRNKPIDRITTDDIVDILRSIWVEKHDTASKVRQRIEAVIESALSLELFEGKNPASKTKLAAHLPKVKKSENHLPALPIQEVPDFMSELRRRQSVSARALEFTILTAARTSESIGSQWPEIDDLGWLCPGIRMKGGKEHRVPLCDRAREILEEMRAFDEPYIFPGATPGTHLSNMAMAELLKDMRPGITVHGFRSTFRDWAGEYTDFPNFVCEMAIAHAIESKTEGAYRRGDLFLKRLALMEKWAQYCSGESGKILSLAEQIRARNSKAAY